jgi:hypothetical protein
MASSNDLASALAEVLGGGVVPRSELVGLLAAAGHRWSAAEIDNELEFDTRFVELAGGYGCIPAITEGVAFTVWVDEEGAAEDFVVIYPNLEAIGWWFVSGPVKATRPDGTSIGFIEADGLLIGGADTDVVVGPPGWLDEFADSWIAVRVRGGAVEIEPLSAMPLADPARAEIVRAAFDEVADVYSYCPVGSDEPTDVGRADPSTLILEAILRDPDAFQGAPLPETDDLLAAAGLRLDWRWVVPAELDVEIVGNSQTERQMMARWGTDTESVRRAQVVLGAMRMHKQGDPDAFGATPDERLASPALFAALIQSEPVTRVIGYTCSGSSSSDALGFAEAIAAAFDGDQRVWGPSWFVAHCHLGLGNVDAAAEILDRLPVVDSIAVVLDRALVAAERSQAREAHRLLLSAERLAEDLADVSSLTFHYTRIIENLIDEVEMWATNSPRASAGRNDRCPCGSGRKYKACHIGRELHPIEQRGAWLYEKMQRFVRATDPFQIQDLAAIMAEEMGSRETPRWLAEGPMVVDLILHEHNFEQRFLEVRAVTLPADEVLLAQQWELTDRSVFEVESVRSGHLSLRNLATGDLIEVSNVTDGPATTPGTIVVGRPLPLGDTHRAFSGFMALPPSLVNEALSLIGSGAIEDLMVLLGSIHRRPRIANTDGHDMVLVDLRWIVPEDARVAEAFAQAGFTGDDAGWSLVRDTAGQADSIVASLSIESDQLMGSVNSIERAEELIELIAEVLPGTVLVDTEVTEIDDVDDDGPVSPIDPDGLMDDPELRAMVEAHMANYETEWLDTSIPALDGQTPREAAADPIGREGLIRLLATFPELKHGAVGMSPQRLRTALGL